MRVLLISENRCRENLVPFPLGVACIASASRQAGHEVSCLDLMFSRDPVEDTIERVRSFQPDCIGLSVRNIDNQDAHRSEFYLPGVKEIADAAASVSAAPIILGGAGFTIFPLECLEYLGLEMGIVGEGERSFTELLRRLEAGLPIEDLPGLALRRDGVARVNPPGPHAWPGLFPPPERELLEVRRYRFQPGSDPPFVVNLQSRRGCHMRCIYCTSPTVEGRAVRVRDAGSVADELLSLQDEHGLGFAAFVDSLFNHPRDYTRELCAEIASRRPAIRWYANLNPLYCDLDTMRLMREAGCVGLSIGNESGSEDILASLRKGFTKKEVVSAVSEAKRLGFRVNCFLLLGGPGENERTIRESVELMHELEPDMLSVTVGIRIYPGCELHDIALREGVVEPRQNLLFPAFYLSPDVEPWLYDYMKEECAAHEGWSL
ncbi:MAG: cobalamin B12-binding domain-containing protein [Actinobacteria bacterium]|nr:cobalamin B12-binding domain-containing protein [Actinomycetota bacterium]MDI6830426.1 cobalamin-dependent protein [Actinomycetota bacterium]